MPNSHKELDDELNLSPSRHDTMDWAALEAYIPHPVHQALVTDLLGPIHADLVAFDYEI